MDRKNDAVLKLMKSVCIAAVIMCCVSVAAYAEEMFVYYDNLATSYYGVDGETLFLYMYGYTAEQYKELINDEAEYAIKYQYTLDAIAEKEVFDRFKELSENKLTVFVSHRLSSAVGASKIVVLDGGAVAEVGTHEELMALGGKYHRLFTTQASRYIDGGSVEEEGSL